MEKLPGLFLLAVLISGALFSNFAFAQVGPLAEDDFYSVDEDSLLTVDSIGVLQNDTNTSSDTFNAILVTDVDFGTLTLHQNGNFTYLPNENFDFIDSFTYVVNNGTHNSNNATVTISVNPINDAPVAQDDHTETQQNVPISIDILENDFDVDNDSLNILLEINPSETRGFVEIQESQVLFTPIVDFVGNTSFSYIIFDGDEISNSAIVTVSVIESDEQSNDSLFDQIFEQIRLIFDRATTLEDEIIQLKEENTILEQRISALEALHRTATSGNNDIENNKKVTVCHKGKNTLSISENAQPAHLNHGDYLGKCSNSYSSSNPTPVSYPTPTSTTEKIAVCHNDKTTLHLQSQAVRAHLANHDDYLGECSDHTIPSSNPTSTISPVSFTFPTPESTDLADKAQKQADRLAKQEADKAQKQADRLAKQEADKAQNNSKKETK